MLLENVPISHYKKGKRPPFFLLPLFPPLPSPLPLVCYKHKKACKMQLFILRQPAFPQLDIGHRPKLGGKQRGSYQTISFIVQVGLPHSCPWHFPLGVKVGQGPGREYRGPRAPQACIHLSLVPESLMKDPLVLEAADGEGGLVQGNCWPWPGWNLWLHSIKYLCSFFGGLGDGWVIARRKQEHPCWVGTNREEEVLPYPSFQDCGSFQEQAWGPCSLNMLRSLA